MGQFQPAAEQEVIHGETVPTCSRAGGHTWRDSSNLQQSRRSYMERQFQPAAEQEVIHGETVPPCSTEQEVIHGETVPTCSTEQEVIHGETVPTCSRAGGHTWRDSSNLQH